jgi:hypothetical protein
MQQPAAEAVAPDLSLLLNRACSQDARYAVETKYRTELQPRAQGQMLGVLLASDGSKTHVLKAFSGQVTLQRSAEHACASRSDVSVHALHQMNGSWLVEGWAPPLGGVRHDNSPVYQLAWARIMALGTEAAAAQAAAAALAGQRGLRKGWSADPAFAALEARRDKAKTAQRAASRALLTRIWDSYTVSNFRGGSTRLVAASLLGDATRGGTGDCCAPKLLHAAQRAGLRPLSMAEVWFGSSPPSGGRLEGHAYAACEERCQPLLGYMLCGLE